MDAEQGFGQLRWKSHRQRWPVAKTPLQSWEGEANPPRTAVGTPLRRWAGAGTPRRTAAGSLWGLLWAPLHAREYSRRRLMPLCHHASLSCSHIVRIGGPVCTCLVGGYTHLSLAAAINTLRLHFTHPPSNLLPGSSTANCQRIFRYSIIPAVELQHGTPDGARHT